MVGNNRMVLNTATMIEALQEYLDKRMPDYPVKVTFVSSNSNEKSFYVDLTDPEIKE